MRIIRSFPRNVLQCFRGYNLLFHAAAIVFTAGIILSGFDWFYYRSTRIPALVPFLVPALLLGFFLPFAAPGVLSIVGWVKKSPRTGNAAAAFAQASAIAWLISAGYKAITGRAHPEFFVSITSDMSSMFRFGFLRAGIFWGWPSSHTIVAFAMAFCAAALYPEKKMLKYGMLLYAVYVGISVSITIHWFSDFVAGAILGAMVGITVGKYFSVRLYG